VVEDGIRGQRTSDGALCCNVLVPADDIDEALEPG
jgi:hypothetical protein